MKEKYLPTYLLGSVSAIIFAACENEENSLPRYFSAKSIEYLFTEDDGENTYEVKLSPKEFTNPTDDTLQITIRPFEDKIPYSTIQFSSSNPEAFTWYAGNDTVWVKDLSVMGNMPYANEAHYIPYQPEIIQGETSIRMEDSFSIPPHYQLTVEYTLLYQKLTATYLLEIADSYTSVVQEIEGKIIKTTPAGSYTYIYSTDEKGITKMSYNSEKQKI